MLSVGQLAILPPIGCFFPCCSSSLWYQLNDNYFSQQGQMHLLQEHYEFMITISQQQHLQQPGGTANGAIYLAHAFESKVWAMPGTVVVVFFTLQAFLIVPICVWFSFSSWEDAKFPIHSSQDCLNKELLFILSC